MQGQVVLFKNPDDVEKNRHGIERARNAYRQAINNGLAMFEKSFAKKPTAIICTPKVFAGIQNEILASGDLRDQWLRGDMANIIYVEGVTVWGAINYANEFESIVI